jgi:lipopolysaccharide/colanic/teichoic acid biosynthesis glycosyltransferase
MLKRITDFMLGAAVVVLFCLVFNMAVFGVTFTELMGAL